MNVSAPRRLLVYSDASMLAGAEEAAATLVGHLPGDVEVTVAATDPAVGEFIAGDRPSTRTVAVPPLADKGDAAGVVTVARRLLELRPTAVHLNKTEVADLRYVELVARIVTRANIVSVVHHVEAPSTRAATLLTRRLARAAGATVAVGQTLAGELESILHLPAGAVHSIPNALPVVPAKTRRPGARFTVGALARFVPHKAVGDLIAAVASLDGVQLIIGGDGPERQMLEQMAWRLGVGSRIEFLGWVDPVEVLDQVDILASAARIEGHPMALLDARRRGIPIVATDVGGVPEIVTSGSNGILVLPGHVMGLASAIEQLAGSPALVRSMSRAAVEMARRADDPHAMAAAYHDLYWPGATFGQVRGLGTPPGVDTTAAEAGPSPIEGLGSCR